MASWLDTIVVILVIAGGLFIFYRALKEPLDLLFAAIRRGFDSVRDSIQDARDNRTYDEVITYGGHGGRYG